VLVSLHCLLVRYPGTFSTLQELSVGGQPNYTWSSNTKEKEKSSSTQTSCPYQEDKDNVQLHENNRAVERREKFEKKKKKKKLLGGT